ncbi:MAG: MarR family transcriptional regulator [Bacilli bacterium]|nr:MarR family transcriptional regulator [Bacilli bacterium]
MICEQMKNIVYYMKTALDNELRKYNITATQFIVLEYLLENEDKEIIQKDVCEYLVLRHSTVIGIMKRLQDKGLIKKETYHKSKIAITSKGKKTI